MIAKSKKESKLPENWCLVKHCDISEINPKLSIEIQNDETPATFIPMKAVEPLKGNIDLSDQKPFKKLKKGYTPFEDGDIIFAKITPCMENGKVAVLKKLKNGIGFGSTEFFVSRLTKYGNKKYLFFYLIQNSFRKEARAKHERNCWSIKSS